MDGVRHWLWRAVDEHGFVLDILLQRHRDTEAAETFLTRLLGEYDVPEVIHTDQLRSYGAAIRELPELVNVNHQQVIPTARCNNIVEQSHQSTRRQERQQLGFKRRKRAQEFLSLHARIENLHHHSRTSVSAQTRRNNQRQAFQTWSAAMAVKATQPYSIGVHEVMVVAEWELPDHAQYQQPQGVHLRREGDLHRLDAVLRWPLPMRDLFRIIAGLMFIVFWITAGLMFSSAQSHSGWAEWTANPLSAVVLVLALGCFALAGRGMLERRRHRFLEAPFLWLPQARLSGGDRVSVVFRRMLKRGCPLPGPGRLDARLLCIQVFETPDEINSFAQQVLYHLDLPSVDVEPGGQSLEGRWTLTLPENALSLHLDGWPRLLWLLEVHEHLPGLLPYDVTFTLPVGTAGDLPLKASGSAPGHAGHVSV